MTRAIQVAAGLVLAAALVWIVRAWFPSEERRIRDRLDALAEAASLEAEEPQMARMARAAQLARFFTEDVTVELGPPYGAIRGRETIMGLAARIRVPREGLTVEFSDVQVTVSDSGTAIASLLAQGRGIDPSTGDRVVEARELEMELRKVGDEWLISRVTAISAIERPPQ